MSLWNVSWNKTTDWAYGGVDFKYDGNGGPECAVFLSLRQRLFETIAVSSLALAQIFWALKYVKLPDTPPTPTLWGDRWGKRMLLVIVCFTFGIEVGFKFASKQLIYLLNPCHLSTVAQIYLLVAPPSRMVMAVFRIHMHLLQGTTLAMVFPVLNTLVMPCELEIYWVQHFLILVIPYYLMRLGGVYTIEALKDYSWAWMSVGIALLYHFLPLQFLGLITQVNLNSIVCPAVSDPFHGRWYRVLAVFHQTLLILFHGKLYSSVALVILPWPATRKPAGQLPNDDQTQEFAQYNQVQRQALITNGVRKAHNE